MAQPPVATGSSCMESRCTATFHVSMGTLYDDKIVLSAVMISFCASGSRHLLLIKALAKAVRSRGTGSQSDGSR